MSRSKDLPCSWARVRLGDVVPYGEAEKTDPADIPADAWMLELEDIEKDSSRLIERVRYADRKSKSTKNRFQRGDVLYGKLRPYLNKVLIADRDGYSTTEIVPIRATSSVDHRYLFYWLKHPEFLEYVTGVSHGLNMPRLGTDAGRNAPFIMAPLGEQRRIAAALDSSFQRVDRCRQRLEVLPGLLKRFREAVLEAAVSGRLTEEWRERARCQFPSESEWPQLANLCLKDRVITYGVIKLGKPVLNGVPCLRTSNVRWLHLDTDGMKLIDPQLSAQYPRTVLKGSEVLVNVRGTLGGVLAVTPNMRGWNVSREVAVVPTDGARINPRFLALWIAARRSQSWLQRVQKGVAYTGINIEDLRTLPIAVPSAEEQGEIVKRVMALFELAERIEQKHQIATRRVEHLIPVILGTAFRGELVPQDSGEEPARGALERITAHQTAAETNASRDTTVTVRRPGREEASVPGTTRRTKRRRAA